MRRLAVPFALLLAAAGCGGNDGGGATRTTTAEAGGTVTVTAHEGDLAHTIHLERDGKDIGGTPSFAPGDTRSVRLRLQPGTYELLCTVGDHAQLGMKGELTVR